MKNSILFGIALSALASTAAFATPAEIDHHAFKADTTSVQAQAATAEKVKTVATPSTKSLTVAENRPEFGSRYQRY
jgi:hypothetical protein